MDSSPEHTTLGSSQVLIGAMSDLSQRAQNPFKDKAFITAVPTVEVAGSLVVSPRDYLASSEPMLALHLHITTETPVATLYNDLADRLSTDLGIRAYSVPRIRSGQERGQEWLISCGALISDADGQLILFQRTEVDGTGKLIAWPKAFNNPMGRCDGWPSAGCLKEGAEELSILEKRTTPAGDIYVPRMVTVDGRTGIPMAEELRLQSDMVGFLANKSKPLDAPLTTTEPIVATVDPRYPTVPVLTYMNGHLVDQFEAAVAISASEQTIEMARPLRLLSSEAEEGFTYYAREPFGRETVRLGPDQLMAAHFAWARGLMGVRQDPQQNKAVHLGGLLPILQVVALGIKAPASSSGEVTVPSEWTDDRIRHTLGL
jgi:hypothetical protein